MYVPKHFQMKEQEAIAKFLEKYSFATIVSQHKGKPTATHLPLIFNKEENALFGHFARPNKQWIDMENQQVLVIFQGPHSYISSSWYETSDAVPTWNYAAVHVYGEFEKIEEQDVILNHLQELVQKYEKPNSVYDLNKVDANYFESLMKGIVAFKIKIETIEAKAKLSQNHTTERQQLVIHELKNSQNPDSLAIAMMMEDNLK